MSVGRELFKLQRSKVEVLLRVRAATSKELDLYRAGRPPRGAFPAPAGLVVICNPEALLEAAERLYAVEVDDA